MTQACEDPHCDEGCICRQRGLPLILLVGHEALPNLLACIELEPTSATFVVSSETQLYATRLAAALESSGLQTEIMAPVVVDPIDPADCATKVNAAVAGLGLCHLNYTGGTKVMAVGAVLGALDALGNRGSGADSPSLSYVSEFTLGLGNGRRLELLASPRIAERLSIQTIAAAQGLGFRGAAGAVPGKPRPAQLRALLGELNEDQALFRRHLRGQRVAGAGANGTTLEHVLAFHISETADVDEVRVSTEPNAVGEPADAPLFELDIVARRGHRIAVISVTTSIYKEQTDKRLHEVRNRAKHLGGRFVRYAMAAPFPAARDLDRKRYGEFDVNRDLESATRAAVGATERDQVQVFGLDDLIEVCSKELERSDRRRPPRTSSTIGRWVEAALSGP